MSDFNLCESVAEILDDENLDNNINDWVSTHEEKINIIADYCKTTNFYKKCEDKRKKHIQFIESSTNDPQERVVKSVEQFLIAAVDSPSFVPPECVAIANFPIIQYFIINSKTVKESKL